MRTIAILFVVILFTSCQKEVKPAKDTESIMKDTTTAGDADIDAGAGISFPKQYTNERFRKVTAINFGDNDYLIEGEAQIFEANFGWVVEDGHNELASGNEMTDAGAPDWGKFSFTIDVAKARENSTLHLILFESSAKDGSRQHELPVVLD